MRILTAGVSIRLAVLAVVAFASAAAAQDAQTPAVPAQEQRSGTISGKVADRDGNALPGAFVRLSRGDAGDRVVSADARGSFTFTDVPPATYALDGFADGNRIAPSRQITLESGQQLIEYIVAEPPGRWLLYATFLILLVYGASVLLYRYFNIRMPARKLLGAQIDSVEARLHLEVGGHQAAEIKRLRSELEKIRTDVLSHESRFPDRLRDLFFWSEGSEIAGWTRIHEIERQLVAYLVPNARVIARAHTAEAELRNGKAPEGRLLADRIRETLDDTVQEPVDAIENLKQQLTEGLAIIYDERDMKFLDLMELHNKAMWMAHLAVITILVLAASFGHEALFLFGAAGGLMSRMARTLVRHEPADYGHSWTTLFLSPLVGAVSAWFGIAIIVFLTELNILGEALAVISWDTPANNPVTITLAVVLGFSERLFTSLVRRVEREVETRAEGAAAVTTPSAATMTTGTTGGVLRSVTRAVSDRSAPPTADVVITALDVTSGERAAFIGDLASPSRESLRTIAGRENVLDLGIDRLATIKSLDAILIETLPDAAAIEPQAVVIADALAPDGRVVVVGTSPAVLFDADATTQKRANHVGPALVHKALTDAGLLAQEPAEQLDGPEPIRWAAAFAKRA